MIRGVHHIGMHVRDIDRMVKFYKEAFYFEEFDDGFKWEDNPIFNEVMGETGTGGRGVMLRGKNCYIELFQFTKPEPSVTDPLRPFDKGYTHICIDVKDIHAECERLKKVGMTFHREPVDVSYVHSIYGKDPEGNIIEIQETHDHCDFQLEACPSKPV